MSTETVLRANVRDLQEQVSRLQARLAEVIAERDALAVDAERWRMVMIVNTEVMMQPEIRTHQAEVSAYMAAVANGMNIQAAVDAAIACQHEIAI